MECQKGDLGETGRGYECEGRACRGQRMFIGRGGVVGQGGVMDNKGVRGSGTGMNGARTVMGLGIGGKRGLQH